MKIKLTPIDNIHFSYIIYNNNIPIEEGIVKALGNGENFPITQECIFIDSNLDITYSTAIHLDRDRIMYG
jgi:hypothetical protein